MEQVLNTDTILNHLSPLLLHLQIRTLRLRELK